MTRTDLINVLIASHGFTSYLEIGCQNNVNFQMIKTTAKVSIDPDPKANPTFEMSSDQFFEKNRGAYDIIFIDGLHHADQVENDIINSMACLNPGGIIVLHDCNPPTEKDQLVPRRHKVWYGNVWRAFVGFRQKYQKVKSYCIDHDCGCGVIHYTDKKIEPGFITEMPWQEFDINRKLLLGIL